MNHRTVRFRFAAAADASGTTPGPLDAVVALDDAPSPACELLWIGAEGGGPAAADTIDRTDAVLLPAFVNAHTHLDLTHIGPRRYAPADGFETWLRMILHERLEDDDAVAGSVRRGVERCLAGGVAAVGDIAGTGRMRCVRELRDSVLVGESYVEVFGLGEREAAAAEEMAAACAQEDVLADGVRGKTEPYTAGPGVYRAAAALAAEHGVALCSHLAESAGEREFVMTAQGPMRTLLDRFGGLDARAQQDVGRGERPVAHVRGALGAGRWLLAHCCDLTDDEIGVLAAAGASVAYCPRSSAYFAHDSELGPHRYRDLLAAGVNVALGTDSIVNLPVNPDGSWPTLGVLDEMHYLAARDGTDAVTLLAMGTVGGARAIGLEPALFTLEPGPKAGLCAAAGASLADVLAGTAPPELLGR